MLPVFSSLEFFLLVFLPFFSLNAVHLLRGEGFEISWIFRISLSASWAEPILVRPNAVPAKPTDLYQKHFSASPAPVYPFPA